MYTSMLLFIFCIFYEPKMVHTGLTKLSPQPIWNATHTDKLRRDLLLNYDKFSRPAQHYNTTKVYLGLNVKHVEFNEFKSTLTVHVTLILEWKDEKLKWNSSNYGQLNEVHLADHEIWQPDIFLVNGAGNLAISHYGNVHCVVYANGDVLWVPPAQLTVLCDQNLKHWPFDTQRCQMKFASWTYAGDQIELGLKNFEVELLANSSEWNIENVSASVTNNFYQCCPEPYPDITVDLVLNRISPSYKALIVTPTFAVIVLILISFWLPPQSGEKIVLNGFTTIIICLFILYFTRKVPVMGNHTPLIVLFYNSCLYIVLFSMMASVGIIYLSRTRRNSSLPWIIKEALIGKLGKLLGLDDYIQQSLITSRQVTVEEMCDHQVIDFEEHRTGDDRHFIKKNKKTVQQDWVLLAVAVDRICFCFFCFLFVVLTISYSV